MNQAAHNHIVVHHLAKSYGEVKAIRGVDLAVRQGEMYGLIGPDGAGKTTMLRILCGLLSADDGETAVLGFNPLSEQQHIKDKIGYMPQRFSLYPDLTVGENMRFFAEIYHISKPERVKRTERLMKFSRLDAFIKRKARNLSGGMKQKLALSCTLIHTPQLLILDEPTTGVDPVSRKEFWEILAELKREGVTILVTTPYMDEAALCDSIALMFKGNILARGNPGEIVQQYPRALVQVFSREAFSVAEALKADPSFESVELYGDRVHIAVENADQARKKIPRLLNSAGITFESIRQSAPGLEDLFVHLVKQAN